MQQHYFAESSGQRVLVVVFLRGGADGLTLVPPVGDDAYHRARPTVRVSASDALDLDGHFGLHPGLRPLLEHWDTGRLGVIHGAGSEDTTRSHFEAQDFMEHGGLVGGGWLGRFMRSRGTGSSAMETVAIGVTQPESLLGAPACAVMQSASEFVLRSEDAGFTEMLGALYECAEPPLRQAGRDTLAALKRLQSVATGSRYGRGGMEYPDHAFGRGLRELATLIKAEVGLSVSTIDLDGWDSHFVQNQVLLGPIDALGKGLAAFLDDLGLHRERVDIVTMTEFGRRVAENTSFGTDHGSGGVMMVLGERTDFGGRVVSGWRDLSVESLIGPGDVPAAINYRDVLAPLLRRHSPGADLREVFPGHRIDDMILLPE